MKQVTIYDSDSRTKRSIPVVELAPNMIRGCLPDGSHVWLDGTKAKPNIIPFHPPFSKKTRRVLRQLREDLKDVDRNPHAQWEQMLRCILYPDREIVHWRWIAFQYKRLTRNREMSSAMKKDIFTLLVKWTMGKDVDGVLATLSLRELTLDSAKALLECLWATHSDFFGGRIAQCFPNTVVVDYGAVPSLDKFKALVETVSVIYAVDWHGGDKFAIVFGSEALKCVIESEVSRQLPIVLFAIHFDSDQVEHLLASVEAAKGSYEW